MKTTLAFPVVIGNTTGRNGTSGTLSLGPRLKPGPFIHTTISATDWTNMNESAR